METPFDINFLNQCQSLVKCIFENSNTIKYEGEQFLRRAFYGLDNGPLVVVSKHNRWADYLLGLSFNEPLAVPGKEILFSIFGFPNPFGHLLLQKWGVFPTPRYVSKDDLDAQVRKQNAMSNCRLALDQGRLVTIFPEGTTSYEETLYPKMGFIRTIIDYQKEKNIHIPIVPASVNITPEPSKQNIFPRNRKISIRFLEGHLLQEDVNLERLLILDGIHRASKKPLSKKARNFVQYMASKCIVIPQTSESIDLLRT